MKTKLKIFLILIFSILFKFGNTQTASPSEKLMLFADRNYCMSGDTVWFKVRYDNELAKSGNILQVQFFSERGNLILKVASQSNKGWVNGYLPVPDSLSTGVYFISVFRNGDRTTSGIHSICKPLYVYNRFEENVHYLSSINSVDTLTKISADDFVEIETDATIYNVREKVETSISLKNDKVEYAIISARQFDPFASKHSRYVKMTLLDGNPEVPIFDEKNGVVVSGKIIDENGIPQAGELVFLSLSGEPPYLDYYLSAENGDFHFFLPNASGSVDVVIQVVTRNNNELFIETFPNYLKPREIIAIEEQTLTHDQVESIDSRLRDNFINKLFQSGKMNWRDTFNLPHSFDIPFYGFPDERVVPGEFFDLDNFKEISRELLSGLQYRERGEDITMRLLNINAEAFFDKEPLRLINGIPVFKNNLIATLKSTEIDYIDLVKRERIYGDLEFNGVLSILLHDRSNTWIKQQPNVFQFAISCAQISKIPSYVNEKETEGNLPDLRSNYVWEVMELVGSKNFDFNLSDIKGQVEICVEGVTTSQQTFKVSKIIQVK